MSLVHLRRALASLTLAATLSSPAIAQALPASDWSEPSCFLQQILDAPAGWIRSIVTLWENSGSGFEPNDSPANGNAGSSLDPDGNHATGDNGSGLDPDGRT